MGELSNFIQGDIMEKHHILLQNQWIEYQLTYKNIKSIYLKVENGQLVIKAPFYTPLSFIEKNIIKYQSRLLKQIEHYQPYAVYKEDGYVYIFNKRYQIVYRDLKERKCQIHENNLYVYHYQISQTIEKFLKKKLLDYIEEKVIEYLAHDFDLDMPQIVIKKYKGRWGSCFYKDNKISFNLSLVHLEKDLIDYVVVHELTHFLQANHSSKFYCEMAKRMPDYKERQSRLKEKHI